MAAAPTPRVRVLGFVSLGCMAAGIAMLAITQRDPEAPVRPSASASIVVAPIDSAAPSPATEASTATITEGASRGDLAAIKQLESVPRERRGIDENLAIARGRTVLERGDLRALVDDINADAHRLDDVNTWRRLHRFAHGSGVALEALGAIAAMNHPTGQDLLFDVWQSGTQPSVSELAEDLVYLESVRRRATPALEAALAVREKNSCAKLRKLMPSFAQNADRRALAPLQALERETGCGSGGTEDCHACLREPVIKVLLGDAIAKARATAPPQPWLSRRVQSPDVLR